MHRLQSPLDSPTCTPMKSGMLLAWSLAPCPRPGQALPRKGEGIRPLWAGPAYGFPATKPASLHPLLPPCPPQENSCPMRQREMNVGSSDPRGGCEPPVRVGCVGRSLATGVPFSSVSCTQVSPKRAPAQKGSVPKTKQNRPKKITVWKRDAPGFSSSDGKGSFSWSSPPLKDTHTPKTHQKHTNLRTHTWSQLCGSQQPLCSLSQQQHGD